MPLIFPSNPTLNQTYSSGSSATYTWNGSFWQTTLPPTQTVLTATSASFAVSASALSGSLPTIVQAHKTTSLVLPANAVTVITGWTNNFSQSAAEWNASTGIFTATMPGTYIVSTQAALLQTGSGTVGANFNVGISKNGSLQSSATVVAATTSSTGLLRPLGSTTVALQMNPGDTFNARIYTDITAGIFAIVGQPWYNTITIQEVPGKIQR